MSQYGNTSCLRNDANGCQGIKVFDVEIAAATVFKGSMVKTAKHIPNLLRSNQIFHDMLLVDHMASPFNKILRPDTQALFGQNSYLPQAVSLPPFQ